MVQLVSVYFTSPSYFEGEEGAVGPAASDHLGTLRLADPRAAPVMAAGHPLLLPPAEGAHLGAAAATMTWMEMRPAAAALVTK